MAEREGAAAATPILALDGLTIESFGRRGRMPILSDVSFEIAPGEAYGLVGESGCGKSTVALATMRYLPTGLRIARGQVRIEGRDIATLTDADIRTLRGRRVAMVYQDPMSSLNPVMRIGHQLMEVAELHGTVEPEAARLRALEMLDEVRLPDPALMMDRYPHQLSGGQQQRAVIAMALMAEPALLVMDEPTTGLDVTIEAAILELVADLRRRRGTAILFISHNLGTVARICDRIGVLYAGRLVETGPIRSVFKRPAHPYTVGLFEALPVLDGPDGRERLRPIEGTLVSTDRLRTGCAFEPRCTYAERGTCSDRPITPQPAPRAIEPGHEVRCARISLVTEIREAAALRTQSADVAPELAETVPLNDVVLTVEGLGKRFRLGRGPDGQPLEVHALTGASLSVERRRTLAVVGESGSGKSTLAKILSGLIPASGGTARLGRTEIATVAVDRRPPDVRRRVQMVFQNPDATLNPSHTIEYALSRPLRVLRRMGATEARAEARTLLGRVRLPADLLQRLPHQLSGGQRQRVAIARALAGSPELVIADEPVSALDVSVQAAIINLLEDLLKSSDMALVIISHDLAVVRHMADWVAVMYAGHVVQYGPAADVFAGPHHPYTAALLAAAPRPDVDGGRAPIVLSGSAPSAASKPEGCPFASRCPSKIGTICETTPPPERASGRMRIVCHLETRAQTVQSIASSTEP